LPTIPIEKEKKISSKKIKLTNQDIEILDLPEEKEDVKNERTRTSKKIEKKTKRQSSNSFFQNKRVTPVNNRVKPVPASVHLPLKKAAKKSRRSFSQFVTPTNQNRKLNNSKNLNNSAMENLETKLSTPCHLERIKNWASDLKQSILKKYELPPSQPKPKPTTPNTITKKPKQ